MLAPLVSLWVPNAFVVSFKLETDENLLIVKSRDALNKYKHKVEKLNKSGLLNQQNLASWLMVLLIFLVGDCKYVANTKKSRSFCNSNNIVRN